MHVSRVLTENIRSLHGPRTLDLTLTRDRSHAVWTGLAGRHGAGKTALLRAPALVLGGRPRHAGWFRHRRWGTRDAADGGIEVEIVRDRHFD